MAADSEGNGHTDAYRLTLDAIDTLVRNALALEESMREEALPSEANGYARDTLHLALCKAATVLVEDMTK